MSSKLTLICSTKCRNCQRRRYLCTEEHFQSSFDFGMSFRRIFGKTCVQWDILLQGTLKSSPAHPGFTMRVSLASTFWMDDRPFALMAWFPGSQLQLVGAFNSSQNVCLHDVGRTQMEQRWVGWGQPVWLSPSSCTSSILRDSTLAHTANLPGSVSDLQPAME